MRLLRSIADTAGAATISLGMFGSMVLLLGLRPSFDDTLIEAFELEDLRSATARKE